jgi:SAM-dependent methyltransferase
LERSLDGKVAVSVLEQLAAETRVAIEGARLEASRAVDRTAEDLRRASGDLKRNVVDQERRLGLLLEETRKRLPAPMAAEQLQAMVAEEDHLLDAMYAALEDRFRGTRADIMQRLSIYLPYVAKAKAGDARAPVIDLGCGRGEWLEVLRNADLVARGVDLNRVFLRECADRNLTAVEQDAIEYLRSLKTGSIGAITAFHLIEHLPVRTAIAFLDEALRVLRTGGVLIIETPNPANLVVGACNFYIDPTHRNPLPSELSRFWVEARGFVGVEVLPLHPVDANWLQGATDRAALTINHYMYGAQDYAVIGWKA